MGTYILRTVGSDDSEQSTDRYRSYRALLLATSAGTPVQRYRSYRALILAAARTPLLARGSPPGASSGTDSDSYISPAEDLSPRRSAHPAGVACPWNGPSPPSWIEKMTHSAEDDECECGSYFTRVEKGHAGGRRSVMNILASALGGRCCCEAGVSEFE